VKILVYFFLAAQFGDALVAAQRCNHDPDHLFGRILPPCRSPDILDNLVSFL